MYTGQGPGSAVMIYVLRLQDGDAVGGNFLYYLGERSPFAMGSMSSAFSAGVESQSQASVYPR